MRTSQPPPNLHDRPGGVQGAVVCCIFGAVSLSARRSSIPTASAPWPPRWPTAVRRGAHRWARACALGARRLAIMDLDHPGTSRFRARMLPSGWSATARSTIAPALPPRVTLAGYPFPLHGRHRKRSCRCTSASARTAWTARGMFGLAVWDDRHARLVLARDRPARSRCLDRAERRATVRFEIQALLAFPGQPRRVNAAAAALYARSATSPPRTPCSQHLEARAGPFCWSRTARDWWCAATGTPPPWPRGRRGSTDRPRLRDVLLRAVERELMSDVPVGVFTSAGLIPRCRAAAARVMSGERIHTYSSSSPNRATTRALTPKR